MVTRTIRDEMGRPWIQVAPDGHADTTLYFASGEVRKFIDRNGKASNFLYDGLGRLRSKRTDAVHFDPQTIGLARLTDLGNHVESAIPGLTQPYPWGRASGYDIAASADTFTYSPTAGMMTDANNATASVHLEYYRNGQLRSEQSTVQPWVTGQGSAHVYQDSIVYDLNGRRILLKYPGVVAPPSRNTVNYSYWPSGELKSVVDLSGNSTNYEYNGRGELSRRIRSVGSQRLSYDNDGRLKTDTVINGSTIVRKQTFSYDARSRRTGMTDNGVIPSSDATVYNVLGQVTSSTHTLNGSSSTTNYTLDGFANDTHRSGAGASLTYTSGGTLTYSNNGFQWDHYRSGTGRHWYTASTSSTDTTGASPGAGGKPASMNWYDAAGNLTWTGPAIVDSAGGVPDGQSERRMYYGADGKLHAIEFRALHRLGPDGTAYYGFSRSFEEFRYDALGRRVVTKFDQACDENGDFNKYKGTCRISGIRRTIWDGTQELGEIQVPNAALENDTYFGQGNFTSSSRNLSPYYGAVAYVFDGQIDRPLAVTRLRYANLTPANNITQISTFTYYPMWDIHGLADLGMFLPNPPTECAGTVKPGDRVTCVSYVYQLVWSPYRDARHQQKAWHGTLLEDKAGAGGLMYRRNRYYDSQSGRFTQEDPIGLAGGLNLYGYAGGDPVNFSDPFGLCDDPTKPECTSFAQAAVGAFNATVDRTISAVADAGNWLAGALAGAGKWLAKEAAIQVGLAATTEGAGNAARVIIGSRAAVRAGLGALELSADATRAVDKIVRGRGASAWSVEVLEGGGARIHGFVPGTNTVSGAIWAYRVNSAGKLESMMKQAYNAGGAIPGTLKIYR